MSQAGTGAIQLWIIGSGPAALGLADACCARGVRVGLVAPAPRDAWDPNYALWLDDAQRLGVGDRVAQSWPRTRVCFEAGPRVLERGYALLDDAALQRAWHARCASAGLRIERARVRQIHHDDNGVELECEGGKRLRSALVVDASGHRSGFITREPGPDPAYQVAWGEQWALARPVDQTEVTFMDWTSSGAGEERETLPPTFLYGLPLAEDRVFVEETVLAARLEHPPEQLFEALRVRLHRRLAHSGFALLADQPISVERCIIPMGTALPLGSQRTLAFGGAASMVHPATGYLMTTILARRGRVADAIAEELERWVGPGAPSRRIWPAIWTTGEVQAWRLYTFGLDILCQLDRPGTDRFFAEFFDLPDHHWRSFLSADAPTTQLMATMLRYYASVSRPIRSRLSSALLGPGGLRLLRGFTGLASR